MAALALKAIDYGAEKIPDSVFEKVPGGYFTPAEKKKMDKNRSDNRRRSEQRHGEHGRRRSYRDRTPPTDYSDYSGSDDTDHEKEYRSKQRRRRARSLGRSISRSPSRRRHRQRSDTGDLDGDMDRVERAPEFPPPPTSEYKPYNPQDYAPVAAATGAAVANQYYDHYDRRSSSAVPEYGYPAQPQHLGSRPSVSSSAARYTPAGAHSQAAAVAQPNSAYAPYNPSDYASPSPMNRAPAPYQPTPPPLHRQRSHSQPPLPQYPYPDNQFEYIAPPSRHGSTTSSHRHRHGDGKHHRTRSAGHHGRSRSRVTDQLRDRFENLDTKDKSMAASVGGALAGGLAGSALGKGSLSTLVGAVIGGLGGREMEKRHDRKHGSREVSRASQSRPSIGKQDYSRSASRDRRKTDRYHSSSDSGSDSDGHRRAATRRRRSSKRHDSDS